MGAEVIVGDCVESMAAMPGCSIDAVVCDPPYHLAFMGRAWDTVTPGESQREHERWAREALRVLKPGGHLLAFGGTRTSHRLVCAVEDAGFEIRDTICWLYGSGFPKSLNVSKAIDKAAGAEREVIGPRTFADGTQTRATARQSSSPAMREGFHADQNVETAPATSGAKRWDGWGTALKPAHEPIVVARKPLTGTVAANVLEHGTGALNVDGCRVAHDEKSAAWVEKWAGHGGHPDDSPTHGKGIGDTFGGSPAGRWPANVVLDEEAAELLDEQTGVVRSAGEYAKGARGVGAKTGAASIPIDGLTSATYADSGGASRFFYCAKASRAERNAGLESLPERERDGHSTWAGRCRVCDCRMMLNGKPTCGHDDFEWVTGKPAQNVHPTVKPISLMRWLVRLVTPHGGVVLDPFTGSGTTGAAAMLEGFDFVGLERDPEYAAIAEARIAYWGDPKAHEQRLAEAERDAAEAEAEASGDPFQLGLDFGG